MTALDAQIKMFGLLNTVPVGISVDPVPTNKAWAKQLGLTSLRLLSDFWPHGKVSSLYGIFRQKEGFSERATVAIDEKGKIVFFRVHELGELPKFLDVIDALKAL